MQPENNLISFKNLAEFPPNYHIHDILTVAYDIRGVAQNPFSLLHGRGIFYLPEPAVDSMHARRGTQADGELHTSPFRGQEPLSVPDARHHQSASQQYLFNFRFGKDINSLAHQSRELPNHVFEQIGHKI